ncbi:DinB family protein [Reichenbachiella versicolor]|uniref:DinB family protein n=1 Tax=Reichenbachiella versicolor TaxID=1821036 RepID=UPI000D6DCE8C|nr:DinB family protein [Reichenbachiella versicolor]
MTESINRLKEALREGTTYVNQVSESELIDKVSPEKWSKKEIVGHLIDSAVNNLQRFTEIQFEDKPYPIRKYNQDDLVIANDYQNAEINEMLDFWNSINNRIMYLMKIQTEETLDYQIELEKDTFSDLRFLMVDYVDHLVHHLKQIMH